MSDVVEAAQEPVVEKAYFIENFRGYDLLIQIGLNRDGQRVMQQSMRLTATDKWFPIIEMTLELGNYWKDAQVGFPVGGRDTPPPPPEDGK